MKPLQGEFRLRVVTLANLQAMCARVSSTCHSFEVAGVGSTRVQVSYSNPDEWGVPHPMTAVFPAYDGFRDAENPCVVLDILRVKRDSWDGEGWQAFEPLLTCPELFRGLDGRWLTREEIEAARPSQQA